MNRHRASYAVPCCFALNGYAENYGYVSELPIDYGTAAYAPTVAAGMWVRREAFLSAILSNGADALLCPHLSPTSG